MSPREEARAQGLKKFQGNPCQKCGGTERYISNWRCVRCISTDKKVYNTLNKERVIKVVNAWREANKDRLVEQTKAWREANKERLVAVHKAYYEANKLAFVAYAAKRRAHKRNAEGAYKASDIAAIFSAQKAKCAYCRTSLRKIGYHIDHIVPLSKGGTNWPRNLQLTCETCNLSKRALHPVEYAQRIGRLL